MNYKYNKFLFYFLILTLVTGIISGTATTARADDNDPTYTITIPSTLTVQNTGWNALAGGISVDLADGTTLVVTASSDNGFNFVHSNDSTAKVAYYFYEGGDTSTTYNADDAQTSWDFAASGSKDIGIVIEDYEAKTDLPRGTYKETVTFTAKVVIPVTDISIANAPTEALFVNSTGTLTANVSPENATDKTVTWSSSAPDYVSINATTGEYEVKGTKGYGSATITATAGDKTATCTITGKVTYTSLSVGTVLHVGDTFYTGSTVSFNTTPIFSAGTSNGVITVIDNYKNQYYTFKRGSNGTSPNLTSFKMTDTSDGLYIASGSGTNNDKFVLAVHTTE